jgi:opacity protein-like surface antigen
MKRTLAAAAVAFAFLAPAAHADVLEPQPSFNDSAALDTVPNVARTVTVQEFPQPSFQDGAPVAYGVVVNSTIHAATSI